MRGEKTTRYTTLTRQLVAVKTAQWAATRRAVTERVRDESTKTFTKADVLARLACCSQDRRRVMGEAWGADAENDSRAQRNTKKVDPSTNRRRVSDGTMMLVMLRPGSEMGCRDAEPGVERMCERRGNRTRARTKGQGGPTLLMSSSLQKP